MSSFVECFTPHTLPLKALNCYLIKRFDYPLTYFQRRDIMKTMRSALLAITAAATLTVSLAGCVMYDDNPDSAYDAPVAGRTLEPTLIYVNADTGLITKYVDAYGEVQFEEGYSSKDTEIESGSSGGYQPFDAITLNDTVEVEGKPYTVSASLNWDKFPKFPEIVTYYNEYIAKEIGLNPNSLEAMSVQEIVYRHVYSVLAQETNGGMLPEVHYELTGQSVIEADSRVTQAWANNEPAWVAYEATVGSVSAEAKYHYSFYCSTYGVTANGDELVQAVASRFEGTGAQFGVHLVTKTISVETEQPCEVLNDNASANTSSQTPPMNDEY